MFRKEIPILLVDDDPDVLAISRLAMKNVTVYGLPLKIYTARSKGEAIALLDGAIPTQPEHAPAVAVAFIDVVMETDSAGLELCKYIRETLRRPAMQLFIRTGQPGVAPEREVIDRYDINGYFTKIEATEDKLYSLLKSGVRQAYSFSLELTLSRFLQAMIEVSDSCDRMAWMHGRALEREGVEFNTSMIVEERLIPYRIDEQALLDLRDHLASYTGTPLSERGDSYMLEGNHLLIRIVGTQTTTELYYLTSPYAPPPELLIHMLYRYARSVAALWKKAK